MTLFAIGLGIVIVALSVKLAEADARNRRLSESLDAVLDRAVWRDEFGQWWNVFRWGSCADEDEARRDLNERLAREGADEIR